MIGICLDAMPGANSIVFMDTCFHRTIPPHIAYYPIDQKIAKEKGLQKYGMHGLSCKYHLWPFVLSRAWLISPLRRLHHPRRLCID